MALDVTTFRVRCPEFKGVDSGLITIKLADAVKRLSPAVFGARYDEAQAFLTAHLLAGGAPWGAAARLKEGNGATCYSVSLDDLITEVAAGFGVT